MKMEIKKRDSDGKREILIDGVSVADSVLDLKVDYINGKFPRVSIDFAPDELYLEDVTTK